VGFGVLLAVGVGLAEVGAAVVGAAGPFGADAAGADGDGAHAAKRASNASARTVARVCFTYGFS